MDSSYNLHRKGDNFSNITFKSPLDCGLDPTDPEYSRVVVSIRVRNDENCVPNDDIKFGQGGFDSDTCQVRLTTVINECEYFPCICFHTRLLPEKSLFSASNNRRY